MPKSDGYPDSPCRSNHFFKVFLPNLSSKHLKIPPAFHPHLEGEAPSRFCLKGPSDYTWGVDLVKRPDGLFLTDGWEEFVFDHSLATGDFLLFKYNGCSTFSVLVFDNTACEKKDAFFARPKCDEKLVFPLDTRMKELEKEKAVTRINQYVKRKRPVSNTYNDCSDVVLPNLLSMQNNATQSVISGRLLTYPGIPSNLKGKAYEYSKDLSIVLQNDKIRNSPQKTYRGFLSQRRPVTQEEIDGTLARAQLFKSDKPFFMMIMKGSYVYHGFYLTIPSSFPFKHLPSCNTNLFLHDPNKRRWKVKYIFTRHPALSGGWGKFAVGNNLEIYDVCIFEVISKSHIKVHIFRVVDDPKPLMRSSHFKKWALTNSHRQENHVESTVLN